MSKSDDLTESDIRHAVRDEMQRAGLSIISTVFWTVIAAFSFLVGIQTVQLAFYTGDLVSLVLIIVGVIITGASGYLLYLLHWRR
ncbi:hypothetical protein [Haloquadratum walsbyi]|jgi:uncharacterized membrane protein YcjF (UPF0283 family)|uniref:Uncharacterized protein n=1 Tax=Haloquadratum walsbyi J07HQW2 TaxID=1238425 RepID=U1NB48_9EURY|nr:hypothetical protein [Haloquadratum walsbyi]ERG94095.1 MAG: hypothetical protein J07HQW2_00529 [Haloquadratum walsbyi J07HQW2]